VPEPSRADTAGFSQLPLLDFPLAVLSLSCSLSNFCLHFTLSTKTPVSLLSLPFSAASQGELYITKKGSIWRWPQPNGLRAQIELDLGGKAPAYWRDRGFLYW
jgi:hypothetical protein